MQKRVFILSESATQIVHRKNFRRVAFTLAEVLITLGIIGVVAALTLPSLVESYKKKVVATKLSKFYSIMSQAVYAWTAEEGMGQGAKYNFPEDAISGKGLQNWYNKNLDKYIKSTGENSSSDGFFVALADGSGFNAYVNVYRNSMFLFYCVETKYCDTKVKKQEGSFDGRNTFLFHFRNGYFYASTEDYVHKSRSELLNMCKYGNSDNPERSSKDRRHACTRLIQVDGWEIKKDYPWKQIMLEN